MCIYENLLPFNENCCLLIVNNTVFQKFKGILPALWILTHRHTVSCLLKDAEAGSSDTRACIIIISDAFNILGLSFEDNLWGILNLTILFCPGFLSQTKLC